MFRHNSQRKTILHSKLLPKPWESRAEFKAGRLGKGSFHALPKCTVGVSRSLCHNLTPTLTTVLENCNTRQTGNEKHHHVQGVVQMHL